MLGTENGDQTSIHLGDIGNIAVGEDGTGRMTLTTDLWEIGTGSDIDVVGKGIIVHAGADDFTSQPSGNAGARIGCVCHRTIRITVAILLSLARHVIQGVPTMAKIFHSSVQQFRKPS